jgi:hypothetical protein
LSATHVLTVTLQHDERTVRAVPQVILVSDGRIVWSTNVDTDAASLFSIQDIIVTRVIEELAPQLSSRARARLARSSIAGGPVPVHGASVRRRAQTPRRDVGVHS